MLWPADGSCEVGSPVGPGRLRRPGCGGRAQGESSACRSAGPLGENGSQTRTGRSYDGSSRCHGCFEAVVELAGDVALQAALELAVGSAWFRYGVRRPRRRLRCDGEVGLHTKHLVTASAVPFVHAADVPVIAGSEADDAPACRRASRTAQPARRAARCESPVVSSMGAGEEPEGPGAAADAGSARKARGPVRACMRSARLARRASRELRAWTGRAPDPAERRVRGRCPIREDQMDAGAATSRETSTARPAG